MNQNLTHAILNDMGAPTHKDGNRLSKRGRYYAAMPIAKWPRLKREPKPDQPLPNFRPNDLGNYRGKRPYTGYRSRTPNA